MADYEAGRELARLTILDVVSTGPESSPKAVVAAVVAREPILDPGLVRSVSWSLIKEKKIEFTAKGTFRLLA
jgi:hypothetical protein